MKIPQNTFWNKLSWEWNSVFARSYFVEKQTWTWNIIKEMELYSRCCWLSQAFYRLTLQYNLIKTVMLPLQRYSSTEHRKEILARVQFSCDKLCHCIFSSDIKSKATLMSFVFTQFHPQRTGFNFWTHYFICQLLKGRCTTNLLVNALVIRILAFIHLHGKHKDSATNR